MLLNVYANSKISDQPVHKHRLVRVFAVGKWILLQFKVQNGGSGYTSMIHRLVKVLFLAAMLSRGDTAQIEY